MYDYIYDLINTISSVCNSTPQFPHPVGCIYLCLGTCLLEYISLGRRQEYDEYRSSSRGKNWELCKELFPHLCPWNFWPCGGRKLLFGVCLEVEYQISSGDDLGPKST